MWKANVTRNKKAKNTISGLTKHILAEISVINKTILNPLKTTVNLKLL
jgi:hypothetical protein